MADTQGPMGSLIVTKVVHNDDGTTTLHGVDESGRTWQTTAVNGTKVTRYIRNPRRN